MHKNLPFTTVQLSQKSMQKQKAEHDHQYLFYFVFFPPLRKPHSYNSRFVTSALDILILPKVMIFTLIGCPSIYGAGTTPLFSLTSCCPLTFFSFCSATLFLLSRCSYFFLSSTSRRISSLQIPKLETCCNIVGAYGG